MSTKRWYVYVITNTVNGKRYVGKSGDPQRRWYEHVRSAQAGTNPSRLIARAIRKYGKHAFAFSVLSEHPSESDALKAEAVAIAQWRLTTRECGYNLSTGGESGTLPTESRAKIAATLRGHAVSEDTRSRISAAVQQARLEGRGIITEDGRARVREALAKRPSPGPIADSTREKMRAAKLGRALSAEHAQRIGVAAARAAHEKRAQGLAPNGKPLMSGSEKQTIKDRYTAGDTMSRIAKDLGRSTGTIFRVIRGEDWVSGPMKGRKMSDEFRAKLRQAWERRRRSNAE